MIYLKYIFKKSIGLSVFINLVFSVLLLLTFQSSIDISTTYYHTIEGFIPLIYTFMFVNIFNVDNVVQFGTYIIVSKKNKFLDYLVTSFCMLILMLCGILLFVILFIVLNGYVDGAGSFVSMVRTSIYIFLCSMLVISSAYVLLRKVIGFNTLISVVITLCIWTILYFVKFNYTLFTYVHDMGNSNQIKSYWLIIVVIVNGLLFAKYSFTKDL